MTLTAPLPSSASRRPLVKLGLRLGSDLLSSLVFAAILQITHDPGAATVIAVGTGLGQVALKALRRAPVDVIQWMSLALVLVFGAAGVYAHDARLMMLKPSLVYAIVGAVMLKKGWMTPYLPPKALVFGADIACAFGYGWAALMFATAGLNLLIASLAPALWGGFLASFPVASKAALVALQYVVTRRAVARREAASFMVNAT